MNERDTQDWNYIKKEIKTERDRRPCDRSLLTPSLNPTLSARSIIIPSLPSEQHNNKDNDNNKQQQQQQWDKYKVGHLFLRSKYKFEN